MTNTITFEQVSAHPDYVALASIDQLRIDLRYAGPHNFANLNLYGAMDCAWLHRDAAQGLVLATQALAQILPRHRLQILDALRPQRIQEKMWLTLEPLGLQLYLANPVLGSIHSFGMAVDVTILDANGTALDMGSGFDEMTEKSHPEYELELLKKGLLEPRHISHRKLLRDIMRTGGFNGIATEWWHFDHGDKTSVRSLYARVL